MPNNSNNDADLWEKFKDYFLIDEANDAIVDLFNYEKDALEEFFKGNLSKPFESEFASKIGNKIKEAIENKVMDQVEPGIKALINISIYVMLSIVFIVSIVAAFKPSQAKQIVSNTSKIPKKIYNKRKQKKAEFLKEQEKIKKKLAIRDKKNKELLEKKMKTVKDKSRKDLIKKLQEYEKNKGG